MKSTLYCYAAKNAKMNLNDDNDIKEYKKEYTDFLNSLWEDIDVKDPNKDKDPKRGPYCDPDMLNRTRKRRINTLFYKDLCDFLNHCNGDKYTYTKNDKFIIGSDGIELFSDQFGFSAPCTNPKHPYDIYLKKCKIEGKNKDVAINNVIKWVMESRTIGGSFLWPKDIGKTYNYKRGGTINSMNSNLFYIEDRVDLTLCEIKNYFEDKNLSNDILTPIIKETNKDSQEAKWLKDKDFKTFEKYVEYFCFDPFVDKKNNCMPYDIVRSDMAKDKKICINENEVNYKNKKENSIFKLNSDELEKMLNNVNIMINKRSEMIINKMYKYTS